MMSRIVGQPVTEEDVRRALRPNRPAKINTHRLHTEEQYKAIPGLLSSNLIRRGRAGLGAQFKAIARKQLERAQNWEPTAYDSLTLSFFLGTQETWSVKLIIALLIVSWRIPSTSLVFEKHHSEAFRQVYAMPVA